MSTDTRCETALLLDFDSIGCMLDAGHAGAHRDMGEDGEFMWEPVPDVVQCSRCRADLVEFEPGEWSHPNVCVPETPVSEGS